MRIRLRPFRLSVFVLAKASLHANFYFGIRDFRVETSYYAQFHTSAELTTILAEVFGSRLGFCGFETFAPRRWVQETGCGFKFLFYLHTANKGYSYFPWGAISLDFVPRIVAGKLKIRPQPKHAAIHLTFGQKDRCWDWLIDKRRENARDKIERIAGESVTEITDWFQNFESLSDVSEALDQQKRQKSGFYSYPNMVLAYAFTLARLHRTEDARREFGHVRSLELFEKDLLPELQEMFDREIGRAGA